MRLKSEKQQPGSCDRLIEICIRYIDCQLMYYLSAYTGVHCPDNPPDHSPLTQYSPLVHDEQGAELRQRVQTIKQIRYEGRASVRMSWVAPDQFAALAARAAAVDEAPELCSDALLRSSHPTPTLALQNDGAHEKRARRTASCSAAPRSRFSPPQTRSPQLRRAGSSSGGSRAVPPAGGGRPHHL